jgi:hypothetical protein
MRKKQTMTADQPLPPPEPRPPLPVRGVAAPVRMMERLLGALFPRGPAGEHRRFAILMGALLTGAATVVIGVGALVELLTGRTPDHPSLELVPALPLFAASYMVGSYLAGALWDATRRIRHRFVAYVLRGGGTAAAMYGATMLILPWMLDGPMPALGYLIGVGGLTVAGAVTGACKWLSDWFMDDLPKPPRERNPA